ncbi:MAG: FeoB-associated Cys-rich membrane protein [Clostridiales bacterium]|nr:FeoB-associated Cys-rich membrane protein [Candidatus Scatonaster coprocaballi]
MRWIYDNLGTIVVSAILLVAVVLVIVKMLRDRKRGRSCGSCAGCAMADTCHKKKTK